MRVYLAAPYAARERVRLYAGELTTQDIEVTSTWLAEQHEINAGTKGPADALPDSEIDAIARQNLSDIDRADVLVQFTAAALGMYALDGHTGGRQVELGYALARSKRIIVVTDDSLKLENVFQRLVTVERYDAWGLTRHRLLALRDVGRDLERQVSREKVEATARANAEARRVIEEDRYPGEPVEGRVRG